MGDGEEVVFIVRFIRPLGATVEDCRIFIQSAIFAEPGLRPPEDPMFSLKKSSVKVTKRRKHAVRRSRL